MRLPATALTVGMLALGAAACTHSADFTIQLSNFTVTFKPGSCTFVCDTHISQMNGHFRVS